MTKYLIYAAVCIFVARINLGDEPDFISHPERIRFDARCLQIDGNDIFIYSGAFHYFRCPKELWRDRFRKIKDAGLNCVETYVPWNWHEREVPTSVDDYSKIDLHELDEWVTMAEEFGFYIIIRPGPYICSEWSGGGFPQWLVALKKPPSPLHDEMWLQTDDPVFLAWSQHWYKAVCSIVAKHQITRKAPGKPGVILFQIENEYNRLRLPGDVKKKYLESLATDAHQFGIDVPLFTCWTSQSRNAKAGPLHGVVDFVNSYPRWNVEKSFGDLTNKQLTDQPNAPLMSMELQGGWYSAIGGKLSANQDGVAPVQTQNITLYALQRGYSLINYYMFVGGTNFDDWASREATTTYDFGAAISEDGSIGERYQRIRAIAEMLREHGTRLIRSEVIDSHPTVSDPMVEVAERRAPEGGRYFFVRTEDHSSPHKGSVQIHEERSSAISFDFSLEPFGSLMYYLPPGATDAAYGQWFPKSVSSIAMPKELPSPIVITQALRCTDPLPTQWTALEAGQFLEEFGVFDRHFIYYRVMPPPGEPFTVSRIGNHVIDGTKEDGVIALADGNLLRPTSAEKTGVTFAMPTVGKEAILLFENVGLHQHTNHDLELHWPIGIQTVTSNSATVPRQFATGERERGLAYSTGHSDPLIDWAPVEIRKGVQSAPEALLTWYRMEFELPEKKAAGLRPWNLHLQANGNGFIYLNGHCLGRYWQIGPQHDYYLPECWLNAGPGKTNVVAVDLCPVDNSVSVEVAAIEPDKEFGETPTK